MEIILRETIDNLGRAGEVIKVADGYARNYLLPRKLAYLATPGNLKVIEFERQSLLRKEAKQKDDSEKLSRSSMGLRSLSAAKLASRTRYTDRLPILMSPKNWKRKASRS